MASRMPSDECDEYVRLSNSGMTTYQIGIMFGRDHSTVSKVLRRRGIRSGKGSTHAIPRRACEHCGEEFQPDRTNQIYCTRRCRRLADGDGSHVKRARRYGVAYDRGITMALLAKRDGMTCRICGKECDPSDRRWGEYGPDYPTIDHIVPLSKGGSHTWDNVQMACAECNCVVKRDATEHAAKHEDAIRESGETEP